MTRICSGVAIANVNRPQTTSVTAAAMPFGSVTVRSASTATTPICTRGDARHQPPVAERAERVADGVGRGEREERSLTRRFRGGDGENRRADDDAERVARHEQPRGRDRDVQIVREIGEQADDDELARPDGERGECERGERERDGRLLKRART